MLKKYHFLYPILLIIIFLSSCKTESLDNTSKRNGDYVWFVEEGSSEGEWIKLDFDQNTNYLSNGECTFFYKSGQKREFVVYDENAEFDTIFYYNLEEEFTHYTYKVEEEYGNSIVKDGYFEAYAANASLALSGTAVNHELRDSTWHGDVAGLIKIMDYVKSGHDLSDDVFREFTDYLNNGDKSSESVISTQLERIDSIRAFKLNFIVGFTMLLKDAEFSSSLNEVKETSLNYLELLKDVHEKDMPKVIDLMKIQDQDSARDIVIGYSQDLLIANERKDEAILSFTRNFQFDEFFFVYAVGPE